MRLRKIFLYAAWLCTFGLAAHAPAAAPLKTSFTDAQQITDTREKNKRQLTPGEIELAKSIFGNSLDYDRIKISSKSIILTQKNICRTPGHCMFMGFSYRQDYADSSALSVRHLFIHEMSHVWQYQNKVFDLLPAAVDLFLKNGMKYKDAYKYKIDETKDLLDYGMEQQCEIIEYYFTVKDRDIDYFAAKEEQQRYDSKGVERADTLWTPKETMLQNHQDEMKKYEAVLKNFIQNPSYAKDWKKLSDVGQAEALNKLRPPPSL